MTLQTFDEFDPAIQQMAWAINVAQQLHLVLHERTAALPRLRQEEKELAANHCNGTIYWRDSNTLNPKMYVNHSINTPCPIHGTPNPNGRLRTYIGTDPDKQAAACANIARQDDYHRIQSQVQALTHTIARLSYDLRKMFKDLGYELGERGDATPIKNWNPTRSRW